MLNWNWALTFDVKLRLGLDVNIKLDPISLQFDFQVLLKLELGLDIKVKLGLVHSNVTCKSFSA